MSFHSITLNTAILYSSTVLIINTCKMLQLSLFDLSREHRNVCLSYTRVILRAPTDRSFVYLLLIATEAPELKIWLFWMALVSLHLYDCSGLWAKLNKHRSSWASGNNCHHYHHFLILIDQQLID